MLHEYETGPDAAGIRDFLATQEERPTLRFLTCGSVDDGKSTLIGRLLYDTQRVLDDQLSALERDSRQFGAADSGIDFALLVDGLEAEREQNITIDVAYRFFATERRKFIVADTPGHIQYTRNMATGASNADLAIVLVDARKGILPQTRRHSFIAATLGIRHILLAVNKIDLVHHDQAVFTMIETSYRAFARQLGFASIVAIPVSARHGENVVRRSSATPWYNGPTMIGHLETIDVDEDAAQKPLRFPVQYVIRAGADFRGYAGTVAAGKIATGDSVMVAKSGRQTRVSRIVTADGERLSAQAGQAVTLVLEDQIELSRGNLLVPAAARPEIADQLSATLVWFDEQAMMPGRAYRLRTETDETSATVSELKYRINIDDFSREAAKSLELNEIGVCNFALQAPIAFDRFADDHATGAFILIDRISNATVGAGMILHPLRRAQNIRWQTLDVDRSARATQKQQQPGVFWFTGLSGSGKSTIANLLEKKLFLAGRHTYMLDGDNIRHGLNRDLGFTAADRVENIRRVAEVAHLMADAGLIVLVSFISPFRAERRMARELLGADRFVEVFVDTPFEECARRDPKGLYKRAFAGKIANFTGLDSPYEPPETPEIHLITEGKEPEQLVEMIEAWIDSSKSG